MWAVFSRSFVLVLDPFRTIDVEAALYTCI